MKFSKNLKLLIRVYDKGFSAYIVEKSLFYLYFRDVDYY